MDIEKRLIEEHSKATTEAIVRYIGDDKARFKMLMTIFLSGEPLLTQRAAWPLSYVGAAHHQLIKPYFAKLLTKLQDPTQHPAIARNILRVFQDLEIPEKYKSQLLDVSLAFVTNQSQPGAIRAFAISTAVNICKDYPELRNELLIIFNELNAMPQPPAVKHRLKTGLKALKAA